jgi:hypothetical protein
MNATDPETSRALVAPCLLLIRKHPQLLLTEDVCQCITHVLRTVKLEWASEAISRALIPHVNEMFTAAPSQILLGIAMCYSVELFGAIYRRLIERRRQDFSGLTPSVLCGLYILAYRFYQVAIHIPLMAGHTHAALCHIFSILNPSR